MFQLKRASILQIKQSFKIKFIYSQNSKFPRLLTSINNDSTQIQNNKISNNKNNSPFFKNTIPFLLFFSAAFLYWQKDSILKEMKSHKLYSFLFDEIDTKEGEKLSKKQKIDSGKNNSAPENNSNESRENIVGPVCLIKDKPENIKSDSKNVKTNQISFDEKIANVKNTLKNQFDSDLKKHKIQFEKELKEKFDVELNKEKDKLGKSFQIELEKSKCEIKEKYSENLASELKKMRNEYSKEQEKRLEKINYLKEQIISMENVFRWNSDFEDSVNHLNKSTNVLIEIEEAIKFSSPLSPFLDFFENLAKNDILIKTVLNHITEKDFQFGVPSLSLLKRRFNNVEKVARQAIMSGNSGLFSHLLSWFYVKLMFPERILVPETDAHSLISRAGYYLEKGDLVNSINELSKLENLEAFVCKDFIADARKCFCLEQLLKLTKAHIVLESVKLGYNTEK